MDGALACCAGGPGLIPTISIVGLSCKIKIIFLPLGSKVVGKKWNHWRYLAFPECRKNLAAPPMAKHSVKAKNESTNEHLQPLQ